MIKYTLAFILAATLVACGNNNSGFSADESTELSTEPVKVTTPLNTADTITIIASGANMSEMKFNLKSLKVPAGKTLTVALENQSTDATMPHNIVFIQEGKANDVGQAGLHNKENGYVSPDDKNVIAHSPLVQIGETAYFTFTTPAAGNYEFICSYPGHWGMMKGAFVTE
ncbi:MAG: hypothetical protein HOI49_10035 [Bacteroidetes bacterium]|jgi:azurin|nr:hypothetical protein [Bacteroidota bacterium]